MTPPFRVFLAVSGGSWGAAFSGGGGGAWLTVEVLVVDADEVCIPARPVFTVPLLSGDSSGAAVRSRVELGVSDSLVAAFGLDPADLAFAWIT